MSRHKRNSRGLWVLVALVVGVSALCAQGPDPVEDLRKLSENLEKIDKGEVVDVLKKQIVRLKTIPEFLEASQLRGLIKSENKGIQTLLREDIRAPLKKLIAKMVSGSDEVGKWALAVRLGELDIAGVTAGPDAISEYRLFLLGLSSELTELVKSPQSSVKVHGAAAAALSRLPVDPAKAVAALKTLLGPGRTIDEKRAAAKALADLVARHDELFRKPGNILISEDDLLDVCKEVALGAADALNQSDGAVRLSAVSALNEIGDVLDSDNQLKISAVGAGDNPGALVQKKEKMLRPLLVTLNKVIQDPGYVKTLTDSDASVRLTSLKTLEHLASVRQRLNLRRDAANLPPLEGEDDILLPGLRKAAKQFATNLQSPDMKIRLAATEFLERLGQPAAAATAELTAILNDPSPFVRWASIRALGNIGYEQIQPLAKRAGVKFPEQEFRSVVQGLACDLTEKDADVRLTLAEALGRLAQIAYAVRDPAIRDKALDALRLSVPGIVQAVQVGDRDSRLALIKTLAAIGLTPQQKAPATQALAALLKHAEVQIRRDAAEALGMLGLSGAKAALTQALQDPDDGVRRAASDALLKMAK